VYQLYVALKAHPRTKNCYAPGSAWERSQMSLWGGSQGHGSSCFRTGFKANSRESSHWVQKNRTALVMRLLTMR
jgi:hypothetical protein